VICLKNPTKGLFASPQESVHDAATNFAADVLLYGQGNSGTILSHFFISLSAAIATRLSAAAGSSKSLSVEDFALCVAEAGAAMSGAVPNLVEGTMVSVARDCCQGHAEAAKAGGLHGFLESWLAKAQVELAKTPDQLCVNGKCRLGWSSRRRFANSECTPLPHEKRGRYFRHTVKASPEESGKEARTRRS